MSRPIIYCPGCGRELYRLTRPQCLWCGSPIAHDQFILVVAPHQETFVPPTMPLMPPSIEASKYGRGWLLFESLSLFRINKSMPLRERSLRIAGAALFVCGILGRLLELFYHLEQAHILVPLPH